MAADGPQQRKRREREAVMASLDLTGVAREINVARLKAAVLADEPITALPGYRHASPRRMELILRAIVRLVGDDRQAIVTSRMLAREVGASERSVRRGIAELKEASLVIVKTAGTAAYGDEGKRITLVWATLIDVARSQGLQWQLFDFSDAGGSEGAAATANSRGVQPKRLSATGQSPPPSVGSPDPSGSDPSGSGPSGPPAREVSAPPDTSVRPPGHKCPPPRTQVSAPPDTFGARTIYPRTRALNITSRREVMNEMNEEENSSSFIQFNPRGARADLARRLAAYGVWALPALRVARENGWSDREVDELLAWCEGQVIDGEPAFGPPIVYRHLERFPPGTRPACQPREEYRRAKRDRDLRLVAERKAREDAKIEAEREVDPEKVSAWEAKLARHQAAQEASPLPEAGGGDGAPPRPGGS